MPTLSVEISALAMLSQATQAKQIKVILTQHSVGVLVNRVPVWFSSYKACGLLSDGSLASDASLGSSYSPLCNL